MLALVAGSVLILLGFIYWATAGYADRIRLNTPVRQILRHADGVDIMTLQEGESYP